MKNTNHESIKKGIVAKNKGQFDLAKKLFTSVLKNNPDDSEANYQLGKILSEIGEMTDSLRFFRAAMLNNSRDQKFVVAYIEALTASGLILDAHQTLQDSKNFEFIDGDFQDIELRLKSLIEEKYLDSFKRFELAEEKKDSGEFEEAIKLLTHSNVEPPRNIAELNLLCTCYILMGDLTKAVSYLHKAKGLDPYDRLVQLNQARICLIKSDYEEALVISKKTIDQFPKDAESSAVLGNCYRVNNQIDDSLRYFNLAIKLDSLNVEALIGRAYINISKGKKLEALSDCEIAHRVKPHISQIRIMIADLNIELGRHEEAKNKIESIIESEGKNEKLLGKLGYCNHELGNYSDAIKNYSDALSYNPKFFEAHNNIGIIQFSLNKIDSAIDNYKQAIEINPYFTEAYINLGIALKNSSRNDDAIKIYEKAVSLKCKSADLYFNLGKSYWENLEVHSALESFREAVSIQPNFLEAQKSIGKIYSERRDFDAAIEVLTKIVETNPKDSSSYDELGLAYFRKGEAKKSIDFFQTAVKLTSDFDQAYFHLGVAYKEVGMIDESLKSLKRSIAINRDLGGSHKILGDIFEQQGDLDSAIASFKESKRINPKSAEAQIDLGRTLLKNKETELSIIQFKEALLSNPKQATALYYMGLALLEKQDSLKALRYFKESLSIDPSSVEGYLKAASIYYVRGDLTNALAYLRNAQVANPDSVFIEAGITVLEERESSIKSQDKHRQNNGLGLKSLKFPIILNRPAEAELISCLYEMPKVRLDDSSETVPTGNGQSSPGYNLFGANLPAIKKISVDLIRIIEEVLDSRIIVSDSFFNILRAGSGTVPHNHVNEYDSIFQLKDNKFSLVYYLSVGDQNCDQPGILKLYDPDQEILPREGDIVIVPAERSHSAIYQGSEDRVMIGVNFYSVKSR